MNKKTIIAIIVVIVVILAVVFMVKTKKPATDSSSTSTQNMATSTATTTVYANSTYGISFQYPSKYVLEEKKLSDAQGKHTLITLITKADKELLSQVQGPVEGPTSITLDVYEGAAKKMSVANWVKTNKASNLSLAPNQKFASTSVQSIEAVAYSWSGLFGANTVVFPYRDNMVMLTMTYITAQDAIWKDFGSIIQSMKLN